MALLTIILGILVIALVAACLYLTQHRGVVESFGIPYIKPFLIFGSPPFAFHKINYQDWMIGQCKKLGRTWGRYDGINPTIVSIDPEFIKQVTVKQFDSFTDTFDFHTPDDSTTLDISQGDTWRALRKMLSPTFTTGKMKSMLEPMEAIAERTVDYIEEKVKNNSTIDVKPILQGFTLDTIAKCAFGLETKAYKGEDDQFAKTAYDVFNQFRADTWTNVLFFNIVSHFPVISRFFNLWPESAMKIREMTTQIMNERDKNNVEVGDFIDRLREHKANVEPPVTPPMIDAQGIVFLTAGFETTATTLGHMCYLLAKNPDAQEALYEEIMRVCDSSAKIDHETIKDMHLLEGAFNETLRIRPPVTEHDRLCTKDCVVEGIKIPKGTRIQLPNLPAHIDEEFFPDPFAFKPERFLKENAHQITPFTWRPFGSGNRVCIAQRFATTEVLIFMAKLLSRFRILDSPSTKLNYFRGDLFLLSHSEMNIKFELRA
uniref:Cytochrome P450 3027F2 n=1 Tax=Paracyclopina nana TaxID=565004 RepID=A0A0F7DGY3_PARNA|nr:cytochrome P450 3027F2 [Paracyclopina nana]